MDKLLGAMLDRRLIAPSMLALVQRSTLCYSWADVGKSDSNSTNCWLYATFQLPLLHLFQAELVIGIKVIGQKYWRISPKVWKEILSGDNPGKCYPHHLKSSLILVRSQQFQLWFKKSSQLYSSSVWLTVLFKKWHWNPTWMLLSIELVHVFCLVMSLTFCLSNQTTSSGRGVTPLLQRSSLSYSCFENCNWN